MATATFQASRHGRRRRVLRLMRLLSCAAAVLLSSVGHRADAQSISWTGGGDGTSWSDPQNWNPARAPLASDDVAISMSGTYTVSLTGNTTANSLSVGGMSGTQTLSNAGLSLTVADTLVIEPNGELAWFAGNLTTASITNRGVVRMTGQSNKFLFLGPLKNEGVLVYDDGNLYLGTGVEIDNSGIVDIAADVTLRRTGLAPQVLRNRASGVITKSGGAGVASIDVTIVNEAGAVNVVTGTLRFDEGGMFESGTYDAATDAALLFGTGLYVLSGSLEGSPNGTIGLLGNTIVASEAGASLNFAGTGFQWFTGTIGDDTSQTLTNEGLLRVTGASQRFVGPGTLRNEGTLRYDAGMFFVATNGAIDNHGLFAFDADVHLFRTGLPPYTLRNGSTGTVQKVVGAAPPGLSYIEIPIANDGGTFAVDEGTLSLRGGGTSVNGHFLPSSGTQLRFDAGTYAMEGTLADELEGDLFLTNATVGAGPAGATFNFSGSGFQFVGGTLGGVGTLVNRGEIRAHTTSAKVIRSDSLSNEGSLLMTEGFVTVDASAIHNNGQMTWDFSGSTIQQSSITNSGDLVWTRGSVQLLASEIVNEGLFEQRVDANLSSGGSVTSSFVNKPGARFVRSAGTTGSLVSLAFANESGASVEVNAGTLFFLNTFDHQPGARLLGAAAFDFARSAFSNSGLTLPGSSPGASPGRLYYVGTFDPSDQAVFAADINGTQAGTNYDQLDVYATRYLVGGRNVGGNAILGGALDVSVGGGFQPQPGDAFSIIRVEHGIAGGFSSRAGLIHGDVALYPVVDDTSYTLVAAAGVPTLSGEVTATPSTVVANEIREVVVSGTGFGPDVQVRFECVQCEVSQDDIQGLVGTVSPSEVRVALDLRSGDQFGSYTMHVSDPRGGQASTSFTVTPGLPIINVEATDPELAEDGSNTGLFTLRANRPLFETLQIPFQLTGSATRFRDYVTDVIGSSVHIDADKSHAPIVVFPLDDGAAESTESIIVTALASSEYILGTASASATILDGTGTADFAVYSATPLHGGNVGPVTVTAFGQGIEPGATMRLVGGAVSVVPIDILVDPEGLYMSATFDLTDEDLGTRQIEVESGGQTVTLSAPFVVQEGRAPHVHMDLSLPPAVARIRNNWVTLTLTNLGNVDAVGVPALEVPADAVWNIELPGTELPNGTTKAWDETVQPLPSEFGVVLPLMPARIPPGGSQVIPLRISLSSIGDARFRPIWVGN